MTMTFLGAVQAVFPGRTGALTKRFFVPAGRAAAGPAAARGGVAVGIAFGAVTDAAAA